MPQPAKAGFNAADQNGNILVGLADQIAVNHSSIIGPLAHFAAGGEGVSFAAVLGDRIVIDHGVHIAAGNQEAQTGTAEYVDGLGIFPVRLGDNAYGIAVAF